MSDWTVERLDALPEGAVIEWKQEGRERQAVRRMNTWRLSGLAAVLYSGSVLADADPGSIRVVSVPVDALLSDGAINAVWPEFDDYAYTGGEKHAREDAERALRAAIAHVTGGQP